MTDLEIAIAAARAAADVIRPALGRPQPYSTKASRRDLLTAIDLAAERAVRDVLAAADGRTPVLAEEESARDPACRPPADLPRVWVVDPVDGTTNLAHGVPAVTVSIALCKAGEPVAGTVYDVARDELFAAARGGGCTLNGAPVQVSAESELADALVATGLSDGGRRQRALDHLVAVGRRCRTLRAFGSAALHLAWVACGRLSAFFESALNPWDLAAGALLVQEAGGRATDFRDVPYRATARDVAASNGRVHAELLAALREAAREEPTPPPAEVRRLRDLDLAHVIHSEVQFRAFARRGPVIFVRGEGSTLTDASGRRYLDAQAGLVLANVGYGRAEVAEATARQMERLSYYHTYWHFSNPPAIELAARIAALAPAGLEKVFLTLGGAESVDTMIKVARLYHRARGEAGRVKVVAVRGGYHGSTYGAITATGIDEHRAPWGPLLPGFSHVPPGDAGALEAEIERQGPETVAAFLAEPILGVGGVIVPPDDYWPRVREICDRHGVLLLADEVMTGFGRTGRWWGLQHWGVIPDMMAIAKGLTGGYLPLGAAVLHQRVHAALAEADVPFPHGFTYSGHPAACAAARTVIEIIEREGLIERSRRLGERLRAQLEALDNPHFGEVRGRGLMVGVELVAERSGKGPTGADVPSAPGGEPAGHLGGRSTRRPSAAHRRFPAGARAAFAVEAACFEQGVIIGAVPYGDTLILTPPLTVTEEELDRIVATVDRAVREVGRRGAD